MREYTTQETRLSVEWHFAIANLINKVISEYLICTRSVKHSGSMGLLLPIGQSTKFQFLYKTRGPWAFTLCLRTNLAMGQSSNSCTYSLSISGRRN